MKKILVTGCAGYIGSVLTALLLQKGYEVRGVDMLMFGGESLLPVYSNPAFEFIKGDLRKQEVIEQALAGVDAVIHLAAIVGDPACSEQPELATEINADMSRRLFDAANASPGIQRFIFSSTCSNYGKMKGDGYVTEESELNPISHYSRLKVGFEQYLLGAKYRDGFSATSLRFSTVYGLSPRMRFDLTVNEFVRDVTLGRELVIFGEQFWRPYCHVNDLARGCVVVLESEAALVSREVFNVGDTSENYQKKMLADELLKQIPDARITYVQKNEDPRDYRVNFEKIASRLGYTITKRVPDGFREIIECIKLGIIAEPDAARYKNT